MSIRTLRYQPDTAITPSDSAAIVAFAATLPSYNAGVFDPDGSDTAGSMTLAALRGQLNSGQGVYNVKDPAYGAKGDGVTDDTGAIQAAITAASTAGGGIVFFPPGTYLHSGLTITASAVVFAGAGMGQSILKLKAGSNVASITVTGAVSNIGFRDFSIDGNTTNQTASTGPAFCSSGIYATSVTNLVIERVESHDTWTDGFTVALSTNVRIAGCYCHANGDATHTINASGISVLTPTGVASSSASKRILIVGNVIEPNTGTGDGIFVSSDVIGGVPQFNYTDVVIANNVVKDAYDEGIEVKGVIGFAITGNSVEGSGVIGDARNQSDAILIRESSSGSVTGNIVKGWASGITVFTGTLANCSAVTVSANTIETCRKSSNLINSAGIKLNAQTTFKVLDVTVTGNTIHGCGKGGVRLTGTDANSVRGVVVSGNAVEQAGYAGVWSESGTADVTIAGNLCADNGVDNVGVGIGVLLDAGSHIAACNNSCTDTGTGNQGTGLVVSASVTQAQVTGNRLAGNVVASLTDSGTATDKRGNIRTTGATRGQAALVAGTVTVNTAEVLASDNIILTAVVKGGTQGMLSVGTITAGTSFVINSSSGTDTSTVFWEIVH